MLKIRLMRIGAKKRPFYRVVVVDERSKRTGGYIENLGTYNPISEPKEIKLEQERIDYWVKKGAQLSVGFLRIIGKAPQRAPRKPKKPARNASQSDAGGEPKPVVEKTPAVEVKTEEPKPAETETPAETPVTEIPAAPAEEKQAEVEPPKEQSETANPSEVQPQIKEETKE